MVKICSEIDVLTLANDGPTNKFGFTGIDDAKVMHMVIDNYQVDDMEDGIHIYVPELDNKGFVMDANELMAAILACQMPRVMEGTNILGCLEGCDCDECADHTMEEWDEELEEEFDDEEDDEPVDGAIEL